MGPTLVPGDRSNIERSCDLSRGDWIEFGPPHPGLDRIEAFFEGHAYDSHWHDTYAIGFTLAGVQTFDYRGTRVDSLPGNALIIHPDERHNGRAGASAGFHYRMLYVEPHHIRDALGTRASCLPFVRGAVSGDVRITTALWPALHEWGRRWEALETDQIILAISEALLALDPSAQRPSHSTTSAVAMERVRQFLEANCERAVTSEELEALVGLDRYSIARQFRARLGTSPYRYLTMRRLDRARWRIRDGHSLADAAVASGFADQSHMTRQFKRAYGLSPGRLRTLNRAP